MNTNKKTAKDVLVSCRLTQVLFGKFSAALEGQNETASRALRQMIMAYVKHVEKQNGNPVVALEFKDFIPGEVNRQGHPTRAPMRAGAGTASSSKKEAVIK